MKVSPEQSHEKNKIVNLSKSDIEELDKVIYSLSESNSISTIPDILYGFSDFPPYGSDKDLTYRHYEDILVDNGICSVQEGWKPNNTPAGYKLIYLDSGGRVIARNKGSIIDFLREKERKSMPPTANSINIYGSNNSGVVQGSSFRDISSVQATTAIPSENDKQQKSISSRMLKVIGAVAIGVIISLIVLYIEYKSGYFVKK